MGQTLVAAGWFDEIGLHVLCHYVFYLLLVVFARPENIRSDGLHETVGDCNAVTSQKTAIGQVRPRGNSVTLCVREHVKGRCVTTRQGVLGTSTCSSVRYVSALTSVLVPSQVLYKKSFLCATNYDEGYYDWHCRPDGKLPPEGSSWYRVCGTPFSNHAEYVLVVSAFCALGLYVYYVMLARSGRPHPADGDPSPPHSRKLKTR